MRTTVDLPDDLFRRAKALAALRGVKFKDLIEEGLLRVLESQESTAYDLMKEACGVMASGVDDLATNPKHLQEFGRD